MSDGSIVARAFSWLGPNKSAIPEDDSAAPDTGEIISRSGETFLIPGAWLKRIAGNEDKILARSGGSGLALYDDLLDDDVAMSCFQQRRLAVISREWEVAAGDDKDPRSVEAANHLRENLKSIAFDRICEKMLYAIWHGYAVAEGLFELGPDMKYRLADIVVPDRKHFGFTLEGELRFRPGFTLAGEQLPPNRFWTLRTGASHDFAFYGVGLGHWCYWPIWFKRNVIKFWALYLEKLGYPTVLGEQDDNWTDNEKKSFLSTLVAIGRDRAVKVPSGASGKIQLMESSRSGAGTSSYLDFVTEQNEALMRVILGQTSTTKATPQGLNGKGAEVHADVKHEIVKADSDLLCESFNLTFPRWLTRWNFGEDVAPPRVYRVLDEVEDVDKIAERDVKLKSLGIVRTDESIEEVYGPGYERREPETPPQLEQPGNPDRVPPANDDDDEELDRDEQRAAFAAQDVAPLYIYRQLRNPAKLVAYARGLGLPQIVPAAELHTTVLYSRKPVDWFKLSDGFEYESSLTVPEGGARKLERLGDEGAIVLRFASDQLEWSHKRKIREGASHDFPEYLPHVTLGFDPNGTVDLDELEPFVGELKFGPEMFEALEVEREFAPIEFSAEEEDAIALLARTLADETSPLFEAMGDALKDALTGVENPEAARVALLEAFEALPAEKMANIAGLPLVLERMAGEAGLE